ncbi:hypothetical protein DPMN_153081 [Dreissena polymorpha]|uniref:Uncharacterized protein n=1 Tax=Dreissena polymorpha TaxID=45954 RepID=A0A9D4J8J9_DREPO|nr:hypothetical protein DPMN_153081 [Dreissena polymorpha]
MHSLITLARWTLKYEAYGMFMLHLQDKSLSLDVVSPKLSYRWIMRVKRNLRLVPRQMDSPDRCLFATTSTLTR